MRVFVKDDRHVHPGSARVRQGEHDEIFVVAVLEEAGEVFGLAVVERQERFHRLVVGKSHHHNRRRSDRLRAGQKRIGFAKLLQLPGDLVDLLRRAATVDVEMRGARLEPLPAHERSVSRIGCCRRRNSRRQQRGESPKQLTIHEQDDFKRLQNECHPPSLHFHGKFPLHRSTGGSAATIFLKQNGVLPGYGVEI